MNHSLKTRERRSMADAKDGAHKKWASLGALVTLQVNVGLMHKLS